MTLPHTERFQLAQALCERMAATYPGQVLIGGVYGSTARGEDTPWSDLELWFVVKDGCLAKSSHLIFRGSSVGYRVYERSELEAILTTPSPRWPFHMGVLSVLKILYGEPTLVRTWLQAGTSVPVVKFHAALEEELPGLVFESFGRILSSRERGDESSLLPSVWEVLFEMLTALCLLNRRWVTRDYYQGLVESFRFPRLPAGYPELVPVLYAARTLEQAAPLVEELVGGFLNLLANEGIAVRNYQSVDEIEL